MFLRLWIPIADYSSCLDITMLFHKRWIDRIEYEVTTQISALQNGVCERVGVFVRACDLEIKPWVLHASLMYAFRPAYGSPYKMATFIATEGLFNKGYIDNKYCWCVSVWDCDDQISLFMYIWIHRHNSHRQTSLSFFTIVNKNYFTVNLKRRNTENGDI